ncbi:MAG: ribosome small subunit-dependent GTPase A [Methylococcales bacterium]|nr:ribosome small subunit-dependent GTPase A [Methylococcales bacterium]
MSTLEGQVISHLGKGIAVEIKGDIILCQTRRKLETVVVGDKVLVTLALNQQGRIDEILPRRSLLTRPSRGRKIRPVAANIDMVYVVFAREPHCDFLLIDQYLAICENRNIDAVLVFNKQDLPASAEIESELKHYQTLDYPLHRVSATQKIGMTTLKASLKNKVSLFAGQSGVGKSSLTNTLLPDKNLKTNTVSETTKHGRHTTTAATLYHFPEGGDLIDSPGVAIFGLADLNEVQLAQGYREFQPLIEQCRFHNCAHVKDKGCAVREAAEKKQISPTRYQRFLKLREKIPRP